MFYGLNVTYFILSYVNHLMRTGTLIKQLGGEEAYYAFIPNFLPPQLRIEDDLYTSLSTADRFLGRLDGICELLPDVDFFILMYMRKEATSSSQIEGTTATLNDVLKAEAEIPDPAIPEDVKEITNYIEAMNYGIKRLSELPLSLRLIREIHKILLHNVRGRDKLPGEFRKSQNWVGAKDIKKAVYVPPPPDRLMTLLDNFEKFMHDDVQMPALIKIALIHSQFELIHPFLDGNGRTGRLLTTFYLCEKNILKKPLLYLSDYFRRYRSLYLDKLDAISKKDEIENWIKFFLEAVTEISKEAVELSRSIINLREADRKKIAALGKASKRATILLEKLYSEPLLNVSKIEEITELSKPNANALLKKFQNLGILKELYPERKRYRVFYYADYLNLFKD